MKTKFSKILGVGLTLVMVLALTAGFALPVGASPDENAWSKLAYPAEGELGGWFYDSTITGGPGPIAKAIDGTLYAYALIGGTDELFKSTDGGHSWAKTYYSDAVPPTGVGVAGGAITALACSSIDADIVYVADDNDAVYKTEDGGDSFDPVSATTLATLLDPTAGDDPFDGTPVITSLAVGYVDEKPHVYMGVSTSDDGGGVGYIYDVAFGGGWIDLDLDYSIYGTGVSPDFDNDALVVAVAGDGSNAWACSNYGAAAGVWGKVELEGSDAAAITDLTEASDPVFPEDFDATDAYEFFVGLTTGAEDAGVYRLYDGNSDLLSYVVDQNIISLDLVGEVGNTMLLAGETGSAEVWWSANDGDNWKNTVDYGLAPTGGGPTYVLMDDDFADNGKAWAATLGGAAVEGAVSLSVDGGEIWHGISMISTDIDAVRGVALSPGYATDGTLFMLTRATDEDTESVFKYDGANWVRIFESTLYAAPDEADLVAVSPDFTTDETVFIGVTTDTNEAIFRSTNAGISFLEQRVAPTDLLSWTIIDSDTIMAGGDGTVYKTESYGRRTWAAYAVTGAGNIATFAVVGETVMVGDAAGLVFVSEDAGETWEQVGSAPTDLGIAAAAIVAFDGDIIYVACGAVIGRCVIDTDEDWADQTWEAIATPTTTISQTTGADAFTVQMVSAVQPDSFTLIETNGAFLVTAVTGTPTIARVSATTWTVTATGLLDKVLVTAIGTTTPCGGTIVETGTAQALTLVTTVDANSNAVVPTTIAASGTGFVVLPDVAAAAADVVTAGLQAASGVVIAPDGTLYIVDATAGVGVWRSLNPDAELVANAVFETITYKLTATATLALAGFSVGSNVLWATDGAVATNLWAYEDGLATEVILNSPISGNAVSDTDKATLGWFELTGAEEYEIDVNTRDDFLTGTAIAVADVEETWVTVDGLDPGTTYYWRVRVAAADPLLSRYSETRSFITALERVTPPDMWSPENGADDATLEPVFSWGEVTGATNYKIIVATESDFGVASRLVETMVTTHFYACDVRLSYNTTYYWRVKAYSDSVVVSDWRAGMFTTMAKPVPVTPPVEVVTPPPSEVTVEVPPAVEVIVPAAQVISPTWIYVIIGVGAVLAIAVIVLIVRTRRVS